MLIAQYFLTTVPASAGQSHYLDPTFADKRGEALHHVLFMQFIFEDVLA